MFGIPDNPLPRLGTTAHLSELDQAPAREAHGLVGPRPATFTPEQTAQTLASLIKNQPQYLQTPQRGGTRHTVDGQYAGEGAGTDALGALTGGDRGATTEYFEPAGTPTRSQSRDERESMARQIAVSEEDDRQRIGEENRQIARDKEIQAQAYAADEAARKQAFFQKWGFEPSPQAIAEIVKHQGKTAINTSTAMNLAALDQSEQEALSRVPIIVETGKPDETLIKQIQETFKGKRDERLRMMRYLMDASAGRYEGAPDQNSWLTGGSRN